MPPTPKDRLTAVAARLFTERGFARVGVNEIVREADVARMSLYNNFGSKEDLALAAYAALSEERLAAIDAAAAAPGPVEAILAVFDLAREIARRPDFRGCAFLGLAAHASPDEARLTALVRGHKAAVRARFGALAARAGQPEPERLGRQLLALWDGALSDAAVEGDTAPIDAARAAAARLLARPEP
jgi:AcrR family transcriptional regulator